MDSPGRGNGLGGGVFAGDVVEAMCSGVWGIDQGSFHLADDVDRFVVEMRIQGRNARVRQTRWRRKIDIMVPLDENDATRDCSQVKY